MCDRELAPLPSHPWCGFTQHGYERVRNIVQKNSKRHNWGGPRVGAVAAPLSPKIGATQSCFYLMCRGWSRFSKRALKVVRYLAGGRYTIVVSVPMVCAYVFVRFTNISNHELFITCFLSCTYVCTLTVRIYCKNHAWNACAPFIIWSGTLWF